MRVVIDTNVFISARIGRGFASSAVAACLDGNAHPIMGAALFLEYEDVLARDDLFANARLSGVERQLLFNAFVSKCDWCAIYFKWRPNLRDEGDNHIVELAVAGNAAYIVTSNERDFKNQDLRFDSVAVISPEAFCKELGQ